MNVLIVDDHPLVCQGIRTILAAENTSTIYVKPTIQKLHSGL